MRTSIIMPKSGLTMTEGTIDRWFVKVGEWVEVNQVVAEITTEKAAIEVTAPQAGFVTELTGSTGQTVPVGKALAIVSDTLDTDVPGHRPVTHTVVPGEIDPGAPDAIVIGGGPGGYVAALRIAQLGGSVVLIEKEEVGGTCLNKGCIPTKSLLRTAEIFSLVSRAKEFGIETSVSGIDFEIAHKRKEQVVRQLRDGVSHLLRQAGIEIVQGTASIRSEHDVLVQTSNGDLTMSAENLIIATGSKPVGTKWQGVWTSDDAVRVTSLPSSIVIVGGGYIGLEFASMYRMLGVEVTVVEELDSILHTLDHDMSRSFIRMIKRNGVNVRVSTVVNNITSIGNRFATDVESNGKLERIESDAVLWAVGREAVVPDMGGLADLIVDGCIPVNDHMRTRVSSIYAIGDTTGGVKLAHVASAQARVAAENVMGLNRTYDPKAVPGVIYTYPELGFVGLTEREIQAKGIDYVVGKFPLTASGRALSVGETTGFVKILAGKEFGEVLGVHILGGDASSLVAEASLAISLEATLDELIGTVHAHPTFSEAIPEAAMLALGTPLHTIG